MAIHAHGRTQESSYSTVMRDRYDRINVDEIVPGTLADVFIEPVDPDSDLGPIWCSLQSFNDKP